MPHPLSSAALSSDAHPLPSPDPDPTAPLHSPVPVPRLLPTAPTSTVSVPIRCQFCAGQRFRRSRLRAADLKHLLLMRYPVRCLFCNQRQMVSFTLAGISLPSHVNQPKKRRRSKSSKD